MTVLLLALLQASPSALEKGLAASRAGRYEEAARLLQAAVAQSESYEGLVALGVAWGRLGREADARQALERAVYLEPRRPEALLERGGLHFQAREYEPAARDFERALELRPDAYAREMLATTLFLAGRTTAALRQWNTLGRPLVAGVRIEGDVKKPGWVLREVTASEGRMLEPEHLRASRLRLEESGLFRDVALRPVPVGDGKVDLEVTATQRGGLWDHWVDFVAYSAAHAAAQRVRLRYSDVLGTGVTLGTEYKWQSTQPHVVGRLQWTRPAALPFNVSLDGFWARPQYQLDEAFTMRAQGGGIALRGVISSRTVAQVGVRARHRTFSRPRFDAPPGDLRGFEAGLERRFIHRPSHQLDSALYFFQASRDIGSDFVYPRGLARLVYHGSLAGENDPGLPLAALALQVQWGIGGTGMPLDDMFSPGAASEMPFPLRGHRQKRHGVLGQTPIGRNLLLANVEWRQRFMKLKAAQAAVVLFYDGARVADTAQGPREEVLHDVGLGLRVKFLGAPILRLDYARSVTGDRKSALTAGIGQVF